MEHLGTTLVKIFLCLSLALAMGACATIDEAGTSLSNTFRSQGGEAEEEPDQPQGARELTGAEQELRNQESAFQRTIFEGAAAGAITGGVIAWLSGGDTEEILVATAGGAAVGAIAGSYIASKQRQYANKEDQLDSMIGDVRGDNEKLRDTIENARIVAEEDKRRIASLRKREQKGEVTKAEVESELAVVQDNLGVMKRYREGVEEKYTQYLSAGEHFAETNPGVDMGAFEVETNSFGQSINAFDALIEDIEGA